MSVKCWASVAGARQYIFNPSQYFMLAVLARCFAQSWVNAGPQFLTLAHIQRGAKHDTVTQYRANVGSAS